MVDATSKVLAFFCAALSLGDLKRIFFDNWPCLRLLLFAVGNSVEVRDRNGRSGPYETRPHSFWKRRDDMRRNSWAPVHLEAACHSTMRKVWGQFQGESGRSFRVRFREHARHARQSTDGEAQIIPQVYLKGCEMQPSSSSPLTSAPLLMLPQATSGRYAVFWGILPPVYFFRGLGSQ